MTIQNTPTVPVTGSERQTMPNARLLGTVAPEQRLQVTVLVRRRPTAPADSLQAHVSQIAGSPRPHLSQEQFAERFGAAPEDMEQVEAFAHANGLDLVDSKPGERRLVLSGSVAAFSTAFGVTLDAYASDEGVQTYRGRSGAVHIPADLAQIVEGVFGLDDRPQARPHFRLQDRPVSGMFAHSATASYTPPQLAAAYDFPTVGKGHGQCVAIIELGGGYRIAELDAYFTELGIKPPKVKSRSVDGGHNTPNGDAGSADGEVVLDIEVAGAIAPEATIVVYFAPNSDAGFLDAVSTAIHDRVNRPSVVSISWGAPESSWTRQAMLAMDAVFQDAAALGVTICCAAGDDGSSDQRVASADDGLLHADFPASSPFALACGGTRLQSAGTPRQESVWNQGRGGGATGGGISEVFARPPWQQSVSVPPSANPGHHSGRGLPDVAANADPATGYLIRVDGQSLVIGGTSAVAPLYSALVALCNEQLGRRVGYLNPLLYRLPASAEAFRDIQSGDNDVSGRHGPYAAGVDWDACTGLGSVRGTNLLAALKAL